jgi:hypothetical protein
VTWLVDSSLQYLVDQDLSKERLAFKSFQTSSKRIMYVLLKPQVPQLRYIGHSRFLCNRNQNVSINPDDLDIDSTSPKAKFCRLIPSLELFLQDFALPCPLFDDIMRFSSILLQRSCLDPELSL